MTPEETRPIDKLQLPFGKEVEIQEVVFDAEVRLLRLRIRERSRFTIIDLDPASAAAWGSRLVAWGAAEGATPEHPEPGLDRP